MDKQTQVPERDEFRVIALRLMWAGLLVAGICLILSLYLLSHLL